MPWSEVRKKKFRSVNHQFGGEIEQTVDIATIRPVDWTLGCGCHSVDRSTPPGCPDHLDTGTHCNGYRSASPTRTPEPILVQISGAVQSPGVYSLASGARLEDLITSAGGVTSAADLDRINTTVKLQDGDYFYLPIPGEAIPETASNAPGNLTTGNSGISYPLDLNTATQEELESLPGLAPPRQRTSSPIVMNMAPLPQWKIWPMLPA